MARKSLNANRFNNEHRNKNLRVVWTKKPEPSHFLLRDALQSMDSW